MTAVRLGRYRLVRLLATGGMGEVFLACVADEPHPQPLVIKRVLRHLAKDQSFVDRFVAEAELARRVAHPNVARVHGLQREADELFIVQEYVHGVTLTTLQRAAAQVGRVIPPAVAVQLIVQLLDGLEAVHTLTDDRGQPGGYVHGDISPDNALVGFDGVVKLLDFGLARPVSAAPVPLEGKIAYLPPEARSGRAPLDRRGDVYAVGVVLKELTAGFALPPPLQHLVERATQADPSARWSSAGTFADALRAWLEAAEGGEGIDGFLASVFGEAQLRSRPDLSEPAEVLGTVRLTTEPLPPGPAAPLAERVVTEPNALPPQAALRPSRQVPAVPQPAAAPPAAAADRLRAAGLAALGLAAFLAAAWWLARPARDPAPEPSPTAAVGGGPPPRSIHPAAAKPADPRHGLLVFQVEAGVEVFVGGRRVGTAPVSPVELERGRVLVSFRDPKTGASKASTVDVVPGERTVLSWSPGR